MFIISGRPPLCAWQFSKESRDFCREFSKNLGNFSQTWPYLQLPFKIQEPVPKDTQSFTKITLGIYAVCFILQALSSFRMCLKLQTSAEVSSAGQWIHFRLMLLSPAACTPDPASSQLLGSWGWSTVPSYRQTHTAVEMGAALNINQWQQYGT